MDSDPEVGLAFRAAVEKMTTLGSAIVDDIEFEEWKPGSGQREDLFADVILSEGES